MKLHNMLAATEPRQVNAPRLNPRPAVAFPAPYGWKAELTLVLVICRDG